MSSSNRWLILGSLLATFFVADLMIALVLSIRGTVWLAGTVLGLVFAQATLVAIWTAWGNATALVRMGTGLLLIALLTTAVLGLAYRDLSEAEAIVIGVTVPTQWLAVLAPLWLLRLGFGWRVLPLSADDSAGNHNETQFGIGQLLLWMLLVGIVLAVARAAFSLGLMSGGGINTRQAITIIGLLFVNVLLAWPLVRAALGPGKLVRWLLAALVCGGLISLVQLTVFNVVMPGGNGKNLVIINSSQFVLAGGSLLLVRLCGYRLGRGRRKLAKGEAAATLAGDGSCTDL